ncbi:hypothetical protein ElyMa_001081000 [Elysia marginata]|uniref:Uncharacterized protein n=1 Tax=Elysia marginata TaxID=1093978 RepID=A0AAV4HTW3_9GAST|nr:hypothetical protein ElyMa_001081000 [Elysia marginata]
MTQGRLGCCSADHFTILVTLMSTIVISGLAGPHLSLDATDVMDHYYFGGQLRGDTLPLAACNPAHDSHYLNCVMSDPEAISQALAALQDQLTSHQHVTSVVLRPRDASLLNPATFAGNRTHAHAQASGVVTSLFAW